MGNQHKGEVRIEAAGQSLVLKFTTNAICEIEGIFDKPFTRIMSEVEKISVRRVLLWGAMLTGKPDVTLADAGDIMDAIGPKEAMRVIMETFAAAYPSEAKEGDQARP